MLCPVAAVDGSVRKRCQDVAVSADFRREGTNVLSQYPQHSSVRTAVDCQRGSRDVLSFRACQKRHGVRDVLSRAKIP
jgi:hypothetical protein